MSAVPGQAPTLPDAETAYNNLFNGVHARVFFNKCAAAGIAPQTQQEAQLMLDIAGDLRLAKQAAAKQADDQSNPFVRMRQGLRSALEAKGLDVGIKQAAAQDQDYQIKQAALDLSQDPTLYNSVLALKAAEAEDIRQRYLASKPTA